MSNCSRWRVHKPVVGHPEPREWALYQSAQPHTFHVVAPGGPVDDEEPALDLGLLKIFPPRITLRPTRRQRPASGVDLVLTTAADAA